MTSFLRGLLRGSHSKHKKLLEDWASAGKDSETDGDGTVGISGSSDVDSLEADPGIRFTVKYLGSTLVERPNDDVATADAIKAVIAMARASGKKLQRVILTVNLRGIKVIDAITEEIQFDISIYRISYCSADAAFNHVFAFIATNTNETMECHAFLCRKRKMAQSATLAIAKTFNTAYELWQLSHEVPPSEEGPNEEKPKLETKKDLATRNDDDHVAGYQTKKVSKKAGKKQMGDSNSLLIDFSKEIDMIPVKESWVSFDDDESECERNGSSKQEKNGGDLWGGSYGSIDLLCFS